jgi:hypothetical protein
MIHVIDGLTTGSWYFAMTTLNSLGIESAFSDVVQSTF